MVHRTDFYLKFNTDSTVRLHQHFSKNARHPSLPLPLRALRGSDGIKGTTVEQSIALITSTYGVVLSVLCMVSKRGSTQRFQIFAAEPKQRRGTVRLHRYSYYIQRYCGQFCTCTYTTLPIVVDYMISLLLTGCYGPISLPRTSMVSRAIGLSYFHSSSCILSWYFCQLLTSLRGRYLLD